MIAGRLRAQLKAGAILDEASGAVVAACPRFPVPVAAFGLLTLYVNGWIVASDGMQHERTSIEFLSSKLLKAPL